MIHRVRHNELFLAQRLDDVPNTSWVRRALLDRHERRHGDLLVEHLALAPLIPRALRRLAGPVALLVDASGVVLSEFEDLSKNISGNSINPI